MANKTQDVMDKLNEVLTAVKERRNPEGEAVPSAVFVPTAAALPVARTGRGAQRTLDRILDRVDDALAALDRGDEDEAADILDGLLDRFSDEDDDED